MTTTRADHVDAIRRRLAAATPGPWLLSEHQDAEFVANAPADIDWLLTELTAGAAREEMLLADLESTRANLDATTQQLDEEREARTAAVAANQARRARGGMSFTAPEFWSNA